MNDYAVYTPEHMHSPVFESDNIWGNLKKNGIAVDSDPFITRTDEFVFNTFNTQPKAIFGKSVQGRGLYLREDATLDEFDLTGIKYYEISNPEIKQHLEAAGATPGKNFPATSYQMFTGTQGNSYLVVDQFPDVYLVTCINEY